MVFVAASLPLSSPSSLLGLRNPPLPSRRRLRLFPRAAAAAAASASASASAAAAAAPSAAVTSTLYDVLGIGAGSTGREIKAAYRRLARESHPDVGRGASADEFIRIHAAYAILSDPDQRARYDRSMALSAAAAAAAAAVGTPRGDRRPFPSYAAPSPHPSFARSGRRTWETDQCW